MILSLHRADETIRIDMSADDFKALRNGSLGTERIHEVAEQTGIDPSWLIEYAEDIRRSMHESEEGDGACDYTDHL